MDLDDPWGSTFINNNEMIITEKNGKKINKSFFKKNFEVNHNLNFLEHGQGGFVGHLL